MNKDQFVSEMLEEVKNIKDLAKEELPLVVKEYINANKIFGWIGTIVGVILLSAVGYALHYLAHGDFERYSDVKFVLGISSFVGGFIGAAFVMCSGTNLLNLYLQPRRMAIKAITSLKD